MSEHPLNIKKLALFHDHNSPLKILICGDIVGKSGRQIVLEQVPILIKNEKIDFVIVNGENAANEGVGITKEITNNLFDCGVDVITTGNHVWDQKETIKH